jgi:hypothetical protein
MLNKLLNLGKPPETPDTPKKRVKLRKDLTKGTIFNAIQLKLQNKFEKEEVRHEFL